MYRYTQRLDDEAAKMLSDLAVQRGVSQNKIVVQLIREAYNNDTDGLIANAVAKLVVDAITSPIKQLISIMRKGDVLRPKDISKEGNS